MGEMGQCGVGEIIFGCGICVACEGLFASKPAPTGECIPKCGSGLAREEASKIDEDPELVYTCGELCQRQKVRTNKSAAI